MYFFSTIAKKNEVLLCCLMIRNIFQAKFHPILADLFVVAVCDSSQTKYRTEIQIKFEGENKLERELNGHLNMIA